jgi:hypothetical protein
MTTLTLLARASNSGQIKQIDSQLKAEFENLDVDVAILGVSAGKWVQVSLSGEDEAIATSFVKKKIGTCPQNVEAITKLMVLKGYISKINIENKTVNVDVGVFQPKIIQATIPLATLQTQLLGGKDLALQKIVEGFGLRLNLPVGIKILELTGEDGFLQAELSGEQVERFNSWKLSLLDRLIILNSSLREVEAVLERTKLSRDVVGIEALGMFEHAIACKLGTDAAGLIPKIGRYMRYAVFVVFNPRKLLNLTGEQGLTL